VAAFVGHYSCCTADTWGSELGVLSTSKPILITTLRRVPTGTNGGISLFGTLAGVVGGLIIGIAFYLTSALSVRSTEVQYPVILLGLISGVFGSLVDSLLGATLQYSGFSADKKKVVQAPGPRVEHISGINFLDNHQVNFLSACITALLSGLFAPHLFALFV